MPKQRILTLEKAQKMMAENNGNLCLIYSDVIALPKGLKVAGSLQLNHSEIQELPEGLEVGGHLDLYNTRICSLPPSLFVGGDLDLRHTPIRKLPAGLTVGGDLDLTGTQIRALPDGLAVAGDLNLFGTPITELPDGLTVGEGLFLQSTPITELPDSLTLICGNLNLSGSQITKLPDGLRVSGDLDLTGSKIEELPAGLVVGGWLDICRTRISALPDDLIVGCKLFYNSSDITPAQLKKVHKLEEGDCGDGSYIYADGILTPVKGGRHVNGYTLYVGKIPCKNVVSDGELYAHCENFREGIADIAFKRAKDRGAKQYRGIDRDIPIPLEEAKNMYRIITGACRQGTDNFVQSLKTSGNLRDTYSVNEMLEVTKGQYGAETFAKFFE